MNNKVMATVDGQAITMADVQYFIQAMGPQGAQYNNEQGYKIIVELEDGLRGFMEDHGFTAIGDFVGASLAKLTDHTSLDRKDKKVSSIDKNTCVKCDLCVISCRDAGYQALSAGEDRIPIVDKEKCTGCSLCVQVCPVWDCIQLTAA